jgi:hypothetical protein
MDDDLALAVMPAWFDAADDSLTDAVAEWRQQNQAKVRATAKQILADRGVAPGVGGSDTAVQHQVVYAILDACGGSSSPLLSDMFARLLANYVDPSRRRTVHSAFAGVLAQLSQQDVTVLLAMDREKELLLETWAERWEAQEGRGFTSIMAPPTRRSPEVVREWVTEHRSVSLALSAVEASLWNLLRLGLCRNDDHHQAGCVVERRGWQMSVFAHRLLAGCSDSNGYWYDEMEARVGPKAEAIS